MSRPDEEPDQVMTDQLQSLPADAFAERSRLRDRPVELGRKLREIDIPGAEDIGGHRKTLAVVGGQRSSGEIRGSRSAFRRRLPVGVARQRCAPYRDVGTESEIGSNPRGPAPAGCRGGAAGSGQDPRPAVLDVGAEGPGEIAYAIVAEILAVQRGRRAGFLRERQAGIHSGVTGFMAMTGGEQ